MNELLFEIKRIGDKTTETVSTRDIWAALESKQDFSTWIKNRIRQGGFQDNIDYIVLHNSVDAKTKGLTGKIEYHASPEWCFFMLGA